MSSLSEMQAVWYEAIGPAHDVLRYGSMSTPTPKAGEVLVRVHASSVNPVDTKRRRGFGSVYGSPMPFPRVVPHDDGAGVITDVGEGVSHSRIGQRVWIYLAQARRPFGPPTLRDGRPFGAAAEYVAIPELLALPLPDHVSFAEGSVIGIPAITAHRCIFADGDVNGRAVLVAGAAGSVGQYAIQFAKLAGARVIATISGPQKADIARELGADVVVNYRDPDAGDRIRNATSGRGVDLICETDFGANFALDAAVLAPQGRINTFGSDSNHQPAVAMRDLFAKEAVVRFVYYYAFPDRAFGDAISKIGELLQARRLKHPVAGRFQLSDTARAHQETEEGRAIGKHVIEIFSQEATP